MARKITGYGSYLLAIRTFHDAALGSGWQEGDIALVFSRAPRSGKPPGHYDLLFENGRTIFAADAARVEECFRQVHVDPDFVIDGCSTNPGWQVAREKAQTE